MKRSNSSTKYLRELNFLVQLLQSLLLGVLIVHIIFKHCGVSWFEALGDHLISFYQLDPSLSIKALFFLHAGFKSWVVAYSIFSFKFWTKKISFSQFYVKNRFSADAKIFKEIEKTTSKVAKKYPNWFFPYCLELPKQPKQIISIPLKGQLKLLAVLV